MASNLDFLKSLNDKYGMDNQDAQMSSQTPQAPDLYDPSSDPEREARKQQLIDAFKARGMSSGGLGGQDLGQLADQKLADMAEYQKNPASFSASSAADLQAAMKDNAVKPREDQPKTTQPDATMPSSDNNPIDKKYQEMADKFKDYQPDSSYEDIKKHFMGSPDQTSAPSTPNAPAQTAAPVGTDMTETAKMSPQEELLAAFKDAQNKRNKQQSDAEILKMFGDTANAVTGTNVNTLGDLSKSMSSRAEQPLQDIASKISLEKASTELGSEKEMMDPNSSISKSYQEFASKLGFNVGPQTSAKQLEKLQPLIEKYAQMVESSKQRAHEKEMAREKSTDDLMQKRAETMNKSLTAEVASSRSAFGKAALQKQMVDNAEAFLKTGTGNFDDLNDTQVVEMARIVDRILSGGQATVSGSKELTPHTARSMLAKAQQTITGKPEGARLGDFVNIYAKTLQREKDAANRQIKSTQSKVVAPYQDLKEKRPELYNTIMQAQGLGDSDQASAPEAAHRRLDPKTGKIALFDKDKNFIGFE